MSQLVPDFSALRVAVLGDLVADHYLFGEPTRLSREAPVMVLRHRGEVLSRNMIVEKVWGQGFGTYSNLVDVHVNHLRKKLGRDFGSRRIRTVTGVGYTIDPESDPAAAPR